MSQITVDLTGIQSGDTLIWDAASNKLVKGPAAAAPKVINLAAGDTLADLGAGAVDGQLGIVRVGEEPDDSELRLRWRTASARWVGAEIPVATINDAWALDGINQQPADVQGQWYRPMHGVAWYHGSRGVLAQNYTPGDSTITIKLKAGAFTAAGKLMLRGWTPAYTGLTDNGDGTWTFTGVTGGPSATLYADVTPVIPYDDHNAGDLGGWGISTRVIDHAGELWAAGFRLQERVPLVYMNGSQDGLAMDATLYWFQHDPTDDLFATPAPWDPPSSPLGKSLTLTGTADPLAGTREQERGFEIVTAANAWSSWVAGAPTKRLLKPYLYHRMPAGAKDTGEMYGLTWLARWIGQP